MKEIFNILVEEYGLEVKKDPVDDGPLACYHGRVVMYILSIGLIYVLGEDGRFYATSSEYKCREWLNAILPYLKQQEEERKIRKLERDFE